MKPSSGPQATNMDVADRKADCELQAGRGTIVELGPDRAFEILALARCFGQRRVNLPMAGIGRLRVVGQERRTRLGRAGKQQRSKAGGGLQGRPAPRASLHALL